MLYRPILTQLLASDASSNVDEGLYASFKRDGAKACVESATQLIDLVYDVFRTETTEAWWWNGLCKGALSVCAHWLIIFVDACTASLVIMTSRLCPSLWISLNQVGVAQSWDKCQIVLEQISSFSLSIRKTFDLLLKIHHTIKARQGGQY